jgi:mRNA interferase MazF
MKLGRICSRTSSPRTFPIFRSDPFKSTAAVILAASGRGDWILCQVTSYPYGDDRAITISNKDFKSGSLRVTSYARPGKLFTANENLIYQTAGVLRNKIRYQLISAVIALFDESISD